jgi:rhodanese-related sulfurtransferase
MNKKDFDFFIDVRTKEEFDIEYSEGSVNIPLDKLEENFDETELAKIDKNKKILLVCRSGSRAEMAKTFLKEKGFLDVENGGEWNNWK